MRSVAQSLMRPLMLGMFRSKRFSRDRAPSPPPIDPGVDNPHMIYVAADDGLAAATIPFQSETGDIIVRIYGRNNAAAALGLSAITTQGAVDTPMSLLNVEQVNSIDSSFCYVFGSKITPNVNTTLKFSMTGSAGRAHIRVGDCHLPANFASTVQAWGNLSGDGATDSYYCEVDPSAPEGGLMLSVAGWLDSSAADIQGTGDSVQFTDGQGAGVAGSSVYYGATDSPGGESGWGGYVFYAASGTRRPNACVIFLPGASLP